MAFKRPDGFGKLPRLGETAAALADGTRRWNDLVGQVASHAPGLGASLTNGLAAGFGHDGVPDGDGTMLDAVAEFGPNPGHLDMLAYVPDRLAPNPGLVVVLHGCTQTAAAYADGAGWPALADRHGFVLVAPQQRASNNPNRCFNWFRPGDVSRGGGEAASIAAMVEHATVAHGIDRARVFVTGLSAGGAMTAAMLAAYPDVFAGGAVMAGLPYGAAANVQGALDAMFKGVDRPAPEWGDLVRRAAPDTGPRPTLSIWHGGSDSVVVPANAKALAAQWCDLHGLPDRPSESAVEGPHRRAVWRDRSGRALVDLNVIDGMDHGTVIDAARGGRAGPYLLDRGIDSSGRVLAAWGLDEAVVGAAKERPAARRPASPPRVARAPDPAPAGHDGAGVTGKVDVAGIIQRALRSAGLAT